MLQSVQDKTLRCDSPSARALKPSREACTLTFHHKHNPSGAWSPRLRTDLRPCVVRVPLITTMIIALRISRHVPFIENGLELHTAFHQTWLHALHGRGRPRGTSAQAPPEGVGRSIGAPIAPIQRWAVASHLYDAWDPHYTIMGPTPACLGRARRAPSEAHLSCGPPRPTEAH